MRGHLGAAAKLTVHDLPTGSPRFAAWEAFTFISICEETAR